MLISNSSGLEIALIAFLYATVPAAVADDKSNPCEFPATIAEPLFTTLFGSYPSKPPWNGTKNFLASTSEVNVIGEPFDSQVAKSKSSPTFSVFVSGSGCRKFKLSLVTKSNE